MVFQRPERLGWESQEGAGPDSSAHLLRWSVKLCYCHEKQRHGHWRWSFAIYTERRPDQEALDRLHVTFVVNLLELGFMIGERKPLSSSQSVFPQSAFLWFEWGCLSFFLSPPLDASFGPVEETCCIPVHGFLCRWLSWNYCTQFCQIEAIFKVKSCDLRNYSVLGLQKTLHWFSRQTAFCHLFTSRTRLLKSSLHPGRRPLYLNSSDPLHSFQLWPKMTLARVNDRDG